MKELYFAYGSNMNKSAMAIRCPGADNLGPAVLKGWGLRARLHADIEASRKEHVDGVLWGVNRKHVKELDFYEGVAYKYYEKKIVEVQMRGCVAPVKAIVYVMTPESAEERTEEPFSPAYAYCCAEGAIENGVVIDPLYKY